MFEPRLLPRRAPARSAHRVAAAIAIAAALGLATAWPARAADVQVRAEVDRTQVGLDDQIQLEVVVEGRFRGGEAPQAPPLGDFDVYSRGTSQSMQFVNGDMSTSTTYTYVLVPKREGKFTIGPFTLRVGGKEYRTEPIPIAVSAAASGGRVAPGAGAGEAEERTDRDLFVVGRVDKQNAYVNEQILYTFYLYRAERAAQISNVNYSPPSFQGFWVEKLKDSEKQSYKLLNGRRYIVTELSTAIFPTTSGKLTIDPGRLQLVVLTTPFGFSLFDRGVERILRTQPITIDVSSLPLAGKPPIFDGAVGEALDLTAKLDRAEVQEGDPVTLAVRIEGVGNVKTFSKPRLPDLPQFKLYDSDSRTEVQATDRVAGSRSFEIVLVPKDEGEHDIPAIRLAYFDTREGRYRTLETKPLHVTAVKGSGPDPVASGGQPTPQRDIQLLGDDIAHIHAEVPILDSLTPLYRRGLFALLLPLPLLAAVGATVMQRRRDRLASDIALARSTRAHKLAKKHLAAAERERRAGQGEAFYAEVSRALRQYVGDKLNVSATGLTHDQLRERLLEKSVPAETVDRLLAILERCDAARFAPGSMGGERLRGALDEAEALLVALDASWNRRGARPPAAGPAALGVLAAVGLAALATALPAAAATPDAGTRLRPASSDYLPSPELVRRGNEAYESSRFADAVVLYRQAERTGVRNGALYYNLGNAYYKNGQLGQAIACYRRAEMLAPRDALVRANLEYAVARREDKAVQTREGPIVGAAHGAFRWLSLNEWVAAVAGLYVLTCGLWVGRTLLRSQNAALRWMLRLCAGLLALALVTTAFKVHAERGTKRGVVAVSKVNVTSGPGTSYTNEFSLHEGAEVRIEERRPDWLRISLGEKLHGWVPAASLVAI